MTGLAEQGKGLAGSGLLVGASVLLLWDRLLSPDGWVGFLSLAAVGLVVAAAGWVQLFGPAVVRALVVPLALLASVSAAVDLPARIDTNPRRSCPAETSASAAGSRPCDRPAARSRPSATPWLRVLLIGLLALVNVKLLLLQRYAAAFRSKARSGTKLLPTQEEDLERIRQGVIGPDLEEAGRLLQVEGRWGEGKSFLLGRLDPYFQDKDEGQPLPAVVLVDVWKHQAEPDLHLAIFEEVLAHPCYLAGFGWLHYPVLLVGGRYLGSLLVKLPLLGKAGAGIEVPLKLPRLPWQQSFQRLVARQRRKRHRTVIVLDEIDRAAARMAQEAITLTRRALDLPGVTVVLSYVDDLIRYKVFNPLISERLLDLDSTMEAVIYAEAYGFDDPRPAPARRRPEAAAGPAAAVVRRGSRRDPAGDAAALLGEVPRRVPDPPTTPDTQGHCPDDAGVQIT